MVIITKREEREPTKDFQKIQIPQEFKKEISILKNLGLEDYEIEYLIFLKTKQIASHKWQD